MVAFDRFLLRNRLAELAKQGVLIGTSSWKYPGWLGSLYDQSRYDYRGEFAQARFDRNCLTEYAEIFKTVSVDAAYYNFPNRENLLGLAAQVPRDFQFGFKVTDVITVKRFPDLPRFGSRAGQVNPDFLNVGMFVDRFLGPCLAIRPQIGILIFEFSTFHRTEFRSWREFLDALDRFLAAIPKDWPYGIELRNREWLTVEYFACLARHQVTHVFNSWTKMPAVPAQLALAGSRSNPNLIAGRFLVTPGTFYETSVQAFEPFDRIKVVDDDARAAARTLISEGTTVPNRRTYIFVNNRLESSAPWTICEMVAAADGPPLG